MQPPGDTLSMNPNTSGAFTVRSLAARDSLAALTELLHRAYAPMAARGINFTAATQDIDTTRSRAAQGQCFVAVHDGSIVGTVTVGPYPDSAVAAAETSMFDIDETARFHQFAVHPGYQRQGLGRQLVAACEQWAHEMGFHGVAVDTAEVATELRQMYQRMGYVEVGRAQWPGKTYRSVVLRKPLQDNPLREHLHALSRYNLWATKTLLEHVDALDDADYRRDLGLFFKSIHGTLNHLLVGEHQIWFKRFTGQPVLARSLDDEAETDRARLRSRLLAGAADWQPWVQNLSAHTLSGALVYKRIQGGQVSVPFAAALAHVFNHGSHHRGQISAALTQLGRPAPELDMIIMLQRDSDVPQSGKLK